MSHSLSFFGYPKDDAVAGVVVFLVALPLCLGIAVACGVPPISGLVAGIVGGLVAPLVSRSPLSVTGPAAGLTAIVLAEVPHLGGLSAFLTATMLAGLLQAGLGLLKGGRYAALVPSAVIKGMLAAIGLTIVWKQLPEAFGVAGGLLDIPGHLHAGSTSIAGLSLAVLYAWRHTPLARYKLLSPALVVVVLGSGLAAAMADTSLALGPAQFVAVPLGGPSALWAALPHPDLSAALSPATWMTAATIAVVASLETLLSLQAVDRLDPLRRHSPPDRELLAQGLSNVVSGLAGGLPVTSVIVRSGANVAAGGRERLSSLVHGVLLLGAVIGFGTVLNRIPLAALAAVLIQVGLNLCRPSLVTAQVRLGVTQLLPFVLTAVSVMAFDLLKGVVVGIVIGVGFVLYENARRAVLAEKDAHGVWRLRFRRDGTFVSKPGIVDVLDEVEDGETVVIDGGGQYVDHDVKEVLAAFVADAAHRRINVSIVGIDMTHAQADGGH